MHTFENFPKTQIVFKNRFNLLLEAVVLHSTPHYCVKRKKYENGFFFQSTGGGASAEKVATFFKRRSVAVKNSKNWFKQTLYSIKRRAFSFLNFFPGCS